MKLHRRESLSSNFKHHNIQNRESKELLHHRNFTIQQPILIGNRFFLYLKNAKVLINQSAVDAEKLVKLKHLISLYFICEKEEAYLNLQ